MATYTSIPDVPRKGDIYENKDTNVQLELVDKDKMYWQEVGTWGWSQYKRQDAYPPIGEQLDKLFHDIDAGLLGADAKTGQFYEAIKSVKDSIVMPEKPAEE